MTAPVTAPVAGLWIAQTVRDHVAATPNMNWRTETDEVYRERYVRDVTEFGWTLRFDPVNTPDDLWDVDHMPIRDVDATLIGSSTQREGVCLDVIDHYLDGKPVIDRDGWFGNEIPVLIARSDGTYTVRDGNHRCLAAILRGDATITVHVVD